VADVDINIEVIEEISSGLITKAEIRNPITGTHRHERRQNTRGPFLESPENFSGPYNHSKISNLVITELIYSLFLKMKRVSLHIRSFRRVHFSVFRLT